MVWDTNSDYPAGSIYKREDIWVYEGLIKMIVGGVGGRGEKDAALELAYYYTLKLKSKYH